MYTPDCTRLYTPSLLDLRSRLSSPDATKYAVSILPGTPLSSFSSTLPGMLPRSLPLALDSTQPACLTALSQTSSHEALKQGLKHSPEHTPKYTPNCTRWPTPGLIHHTLPRMLSKSSQVHRVCSQVHSRACSHGHSHLHLMAHSQPAWLYTPKPALKKLSSTLLGTLSSTLQIALDGSLPDYLALHSHGLSQEGRHSQSHLTVCSHVPSCTLDLETRWVAEARHQQESVAGATHRRLEAGGIWLALFGRRHVACGERQMVGGICWPDHDVGWYQSLNSILSPATLTRSHYPSLLWCWQLKN